MKSVRALAGYIEAASQPQSSAYRLGWEDPGGGVMVAAALIAFVSVILIGLTADAFRHRSTSRH